MFRKLVTFVLKFKAMNKLLNKLNTLYNERKNTFISIGIIFGVIIAFIVFKKSIWEQPEKAEILSHIAQTYIKNYENNKIASL